MKKPQVMGLSGQHWTLLDFKMVPRAGLEPARLTPLPPQDSVSTNSTTWAYSLIDLLQGYHSDYLWPQVQQQEDHFQGLQLQN